MRDAHPSLGTSEPASADVALLNQAIRLVDGLPDALFTCATSFTPGGNVGRHLRHCLDFYDSFLRGFLSGRVDYVHRARDEEVETRRSRALERLHDAARRLERIAPAELERPLFVRAEDEPIGASPGSGTCWSRSTVHRELQFLASHTVHHFALIAVLLRTLGHEPPAEFGIAPSTLRQWRESALEAAAG